MKLYETKGKCVSAFEQADVKNALEDLALKSGRAIDADIKENTETLIGHYYIQCGTLEYCNAEIARLTRLKKATEKILSRIEQYDKEYAKYLLKDELN